MSCGNGITIKKYIFTGEKGDKGETGLDGAAASFPIEAINISVTNPGFDNLQEVLDALLYVPIIINSFTTITVLFENRAVTDPSADFTIDFNWSVTGSDVAQTLVGPSEMAPVSIAAGVRVKTVTMTNFNTNETFTLTVDDGTIQPTKNINIAFANKLYYGDAVIPGVTDETFIKSLSSSLQKTKVITVPTDLSGSTYFWFALPVAYGTPIFKDATTGFAYDMQNPIPFTAGNGNIFNNNLGYAEDYYLYRSTNAGPYTAGIEIT